jgi:hypothetical protein
MLDLTKFLMCSTDLNMDNINGMTYTSRRYSVSRQVLARISLVDGSVTQLIHILHFFTSPLQMLRKIQRSQIWKTKGPGNGTLFVYNDQETPCPEKMEHDVRSKLMHHQTGNCFHRDMTQSSSLHNSQKFPDWPPGSRTANDTALRHSMQFYRYFVSQSSEFCHHNPLCSFLTSNTKGTRTFRYRLNPETFGYTLVGSSKKERTDNFVSHQSAPHVDLRPITLMLNNIMRIFISLHTFVSGDCYTHIKCCFIRK